MVIKCKLTLKDKSRLLRSSITTTPLAPEHRAALSKIPELQAAQYLFCQRLHIWLSQVSLWLGHIKMKGLGQATTVLSFIAYPIALVIRWLLYILYWLVSPFVFMARLTREILMLPVRAVGHFLVHFEVSNQEAHSTNLQLTCTRHSSTSSPSP